MNARIVIGLAIVIAVVLPTAAHATQEHEKVNICHATSSESHPWEAIEIDESALETHLGHGDFKYEGAVKDNGKPKHTGNTWCQENAPEPSIEEETPTPEPEAPAPAARPDTPAATDEVEMPAFGK